jgi:opacity protein-like surface antigen
VAWSFYSPLLFILRRIALKYTFFSSKNPRLYHYVLSTGIDWAYTEYWNFRLEYNYYQYNPLDLTILHIYEISDFGGMGQLKLSANTVRVALNYWF